VPSKDLQTPPSEIHNRISRLQSCLQESHTDLAWIQQKADLFYFTGTIQNGHLFVPAHGSPFILIHKNLERAAAESPLETLLPLHSPGEIPAVFRKLAIPIPGNIGLELDVLPANLYLSYQGLFEKSTLTDISPIIRRIRSVKSDYEIGLIRNAARLADAVLEGVASLLRPGITEVELAGKVEAHARQLGHQGIVRMRLWGSELFYGHLLSGPAAAVPSYLSSPTGGEGLSPAVAQGSGFRRIQRHEPVLVDYVFAFNGYLADCARIFSLGKLPEILLEGHRRMLELSAEIRRMARPGTVSGSLYDHAVAFAGTHGMGERFMGADAYRIRFIGHGVGLELDEYPFLAKGQTQVLENGMTLALEPKLIFPGLGVVGIENTHVVGPEGLESLNAFPEEIILL